MTSVSEILARLNLSNRDLNNISLSQLRTIFQDLTVKEISSLCAVNRRFNTLCKDESFWRNKVSGDYGIKKKYGDTWRETAITMYEVNMINLGAKWTNGKTYREILNDALQNGSGSIIRAQTLYLLPYAKYQPAINDILFDALDEKEIQDFANSFLHKPYTDEELNSILLVKSNEIDVIYTTVRIYKGKGLYLPGVTIRGTTTTGDALLSYDFLRKMIDPIIYVMQFSSFSAERLAKVSY